MCLQWVEAKDDVCMCVRGKQKKEQCTLDYFCIGFVIGLYSSESDHTLVEQFLP